jgi:hypothetical protein
MSRGAIALAAVVTVLVLAGCGGGGEAGDSSIAAGSLSKATFIKKADAICTKGNARLQKGFAAYLRKNKKSIVTLRHPSKADYEGLIGGVLVPNLEWEIEEIRALGAPSGDEAKIEEIFTALEEGIEVAENDPEAVKHSSEAIFGVGSRLAKEYGLVVCGSR